MATLRSSAFVGIAEEEGGSFMKLDIDKIGNEGRVRISGSMFVEDATNVREKLLALFDEGVANLTFDLSGLEYIDSSGLGMLISINKRCMQKGGKIRIMELRGMAEELFKLTRLDLVFDIVKNK
jgi:anti-sigma B factor antagonist